MKILLNWFPPAITRIPSPAMSILKSNFVAHGYEVDICYWNLIFRDLLFKFSGTDSGNEMTEIETLLPFLYILSCQYQDESSKAKIKNCYHALHPAFFNIDKEKSYSQELAKTAQFITDQMRVSLELIRKKNSYGLIGMSVKLLQMIPANVYANICKSLNPKLPILIGGFSTQQEAIAYLENFPMFDYAIWGEGEFPTVQLANYLDGKVKIDDVPNLAYKNELGQIVYTSHNRNYLDLNTLCPDYTEYFEHIQKLHIDNLLTMVPIESSRGCHWNRCHFCFLTDGYRNRSKGTDKIITEINVSRQKYHCSNFIFLDNDIIFNDIDTFKKLLDKFIQIKEKDENFGIWNGEVVTKGLTASIIKRMSLAGFRSIQIGYEAISNQLLKKIDKKNSFASNLLFVKWSAVFHLKILGLNIITGLLEEKDEDILESTKNLHFLRFFLKRNELTHQIIPLQVMRTSRYFRMIKDDLSKWNDNNLFHMLPKKYIKDKDKYTLFYFSSLVRNELWKSFEGINRYYESTDFNYKLILKSQHIICYHEYVGNIMVSDLEFELSSLYWKILKYCNEEVRSLDDIITYFSDELHEKQEICKILDELNAEYLLYSSTDYAENVTIINTNSVN